jgi:hypothetical protein
MTPNLRFVRGGYSCTQIGNHDSCENKLVRIIASHLPAINLREAECEVDC